MRLQINETCPERSKFMNGINVKLSLFPSWWKCTIECFFQDSNVTSFFSPKSPLRLAYFLLNFFLTLWCDIFLTAIGLTSIENVEQFKYLGTTLTNRKSIQKEIKSKLKLGNACYHSVQNLLPSSLLSKNLKIKIYRTIILPVVLYGCETWSLTLREDVGRGCLRIGCWGEYLGLRGAR